jgi:hypothetical protein
MATSPFVCGPPSTVAKPSEFIKAQAKEGRILNDRPDKDGKVPPIALLYAPFGRFLDHIRDRPEKQPGVDLREFQFAVDDFASAMCEHFIDEDRRRDKVLPLLNDIFECYHPFKLPPLDPTVIAEKRASGGHAKGPAELMETIVEFQNEFGSGQTDPEMQITSSYLQMFNREKDGQFQDTFKKHLCPSLVILIIGIKMQISSLYLLIHTSFQVHTSASVPLFFLTAQDLWRSPHCSRPVRLLVTTSTGLHCSKLFERRVFYATTSAETPNGSSMIRP